MRSHFMAQSWYRAPSIPQALIWRRVHSLLGIWLVLFLIEHLITNSQAALFVGDYGAGFVNAVNSIKNLPYLPIIEWTFIGIPLIVHTVWGVYRLFTSSTNVWPSDGSTPSLPQYGTNQAYTWQRITSWLLILGIAGHVIQMRFLDYPTSAQLSGQNFYFVRISPDEGLERLSARLNFNYFDQKESQHIIHSMNLGLASFGDIPQNSVMGEHVREVKSWLTAFEAVKIKENDLIAVTPSFGLAELLLVRNTFKSFLMLFLYTFFVLATCFHAFNGLWTSMITWGVTLSNKSQRLMRWGTTFLMVLITFLGLASIWGTYWVNLIY